MCSRIAPAYVVTVGENCLTAGTRRVSDSSSRRVCPSTPSTVSIAGSLSSLNYMRPTKASLSSHANVGSGIGTISNREFAIAHMSPRGVVYAGWA